MALSPVKALAFALVWAWWVSAMTEATSETKELPPCKGWDVLTGCESTTSQLFATLALGTIPGASHDLNVAFAILGVICRAVGIWAVMELVRGT